MDQTENGSKSSRPMPISQPDLGTMTLQDFKTWSTNALKTYLSLRNKQNEGPFEEQDSKFTFNSIVVLGF